MRSFFAELRRRNVFRAAAAYGISAWIVMQVVDVMFPALRLPDWAVSAVAALIAIGFPFVLMFSWAFEVTPDGLKREKDIVPDQSVAHVTARKLNQLIIAGLVLAVGLLLTDRFINRDADNAAGKVAAGSVILSIAVMPFVNMSGDADNEYFSDGLATELLTVLSKNPQLRVVARTSSFRFKGRNEDTRTIGEQLNVANILEGSVRKSGTRIRIAATLIESKSGFSLWSETYDRELTDIFVIQDEITANVVGALNVKLLGEAAPRPDTIHGTENIEAYNLYLKGRYLRENPSEANIQKSIEVLSQAIELDPNYAQAYSQLALSQHDWMLAFSHDKDYDAEIQAMRLNVEKALALNDKLAQAYIAQAMLLIVDDRDIAAADKSLETALRLEPDNADALTWYATTRLMTGRFDDSIAVSRRAMELDPQGSSIMLGIGYSLSGQQELALATFNRLLEINPDVAFVHGWIGQINMLQGELDKADAEYRQEPIEWLRDMGSIYLMYRRRQLVEWEQAVARFTEDHSEQNPFQLVEIYADAGQIDKAFDWLDVAYEARDPGLNFIVSSLFTMKLRDDPRWPVFLRKINRADLI